MPISTVEFMSDALNPPVTTTGEATQSFTSTSEYTVLTLTWEVKPRHFYTLVNTVGLAEIILWVEYTKQ